MKKAILCSMNPDKAQPLASVLEREFCLECCDENHIFEAAEKLGSCDLLVVDGYADVFGSSIWDVEGDLERYTGIFNFCIRCASAAARLMKEKETQGSIVILTSARAQLARPGDGLYGSISSALHRAVESFGIDLAPYKIRINCVSVGLLETQERDDREKAWLANKIPMRRIGTIEDVVNACTFLGSGESSYITGITIRIDGGLMLPTMPDNKPDCSADDFVGFDYVKMKKERKRT